MNPEQPAAEHTWSERNVRPAILLYVVGVFVGFIALAHFVFGSEEAVKALVVAAIGSLGATVPGVLKRIEYRLTPSHLLKRTLGKEKKGDFEEVFKWDELSHLVPTKSGFKYYKKLEEPKRLLRAMKVHLLSNHSGEFHVGPGDRSRVETIIDQRAIPRTKPLRAIRKSR